MRDDIGTPVVFLSDDVGTPTVYYGGGGGGGRSGRIKSAGGLTRVINLPNGNPGDFGRQGDGQYFGGQGGDWGAYGSYGREFSGFTTPLTRGQHGNPGAGGKAVELNGFTVTWTATGTRLGEIS